MNKTIKMVDATQLVKDILLPLLTPEQSDAVQLGTVPVDIPFPDVEGVTVSLRGFSDPSDKNKRYVLASLNVNVPASEIFNE